MSEDFLVGLASIVIIGIGAQWLAWRLRLPSIMLLLIGGFVAGPLTGFLDPDALVGELLLPIVSISVAVILFEGGLSLRISELRGIGSVVRNLVTIGLLVTWIIAAGAARMILGLDLALAVLLGSIVVVTGPTVIVPLLRHLRLKRKVGATLKWEGILIDPIGAILAVLVFEAVFAGGFREATTLSAFGLIKTASIGSAVGLIGAEIMILVLARYWVPDFLHASVTLMVVVGAYTASNVLQVESGLIAVTLMGIVLANQRTVAVKHIVKFKENLRVLLISALFILLAARLEFVSFTQIGLGGLAFVAVLIIVARPLAVLASTVRSGLHWNERILLASVAPRGIVAAAVASVLALRLVEAGFSEAEVILPLTFIVIVGTVIVYGLVAAPIARRLQLANPNPQGVLFVGAQSWARSLAAVLKDQGFPVIVADTNSYNIAESRKLGLPALKGNILAEDIIDYVEMEEIGRVLALTSNDEVNSLACLSLTDVFGSSEVYQLAPKGGGGGGGKDARAHGRVLFGDEVTYEWLRLAFLPGGVVNSLIKRILPKGGNVNLQELREDVDYEEFRRSNSALPLFLIGENGSLSVFTVDNKPPLRAGDKVIYLMEKERKQ